MPESAKKQINIITACTEKATQQAPDAKSPGHTSETAHANVASNLSIPQTAQKSNTPQQIFPKSPGVMTADTSPFERMVPKSSNQARKQPVEFTRMHFPKSEVDDIKIESPTRISSDESEVQPEITGDSILSILQAAQASNTPEQVVSSALFFVNKLHCMIAAGASILKKACLYAKIMYDLQPLEVLFLELLDYQYLCKDALEFMRNLDDGSVKLIITSPPYNVGKEYEARTKIESYLNKITPVIHEMVRVLADDGSICWQVGNYVENGEVFPLDIYYYPIFKNLGLKLRNRIIWHFGHGLHCKNRFSGRYETILWFTKSDHYTFNLDSVRVPAKYPGKRYYKGDKKGQISGNRLGKNPEDVWELTVNRLYDDWDSLIWDIPNVKSNHPEKEDHPCQFPIELVERCVLALTNDGDIVYDPFAGVGSTLLGALKNSRQAYGTELEQKYVDIGLGRIERLKNDTLRTRPIYQTIYKPTGKESVAKIPDEWKELS